MREGLKCLNVFVDFGAILLYKLRVGIDLSFFLATPHFVGLSRLVSSSGVCDNKRTVMRLFG